MATATQLDIKDTGTRGFLLWLKNEPAMAPLYRAIEPKLRAHIAAAKSKTLAGLGDAMSINVASDFTPPAVDFSSVLTTIPPISDSTTAAASTAPASGSFASTVQSLLSSAGTVLLTAQQLSTAKKVTDIQLQRAQAGLPPLNINTASLGLPQVGVQVGLASGTQTLLLWGAGILGVFLVLPRLLRRRA